MSNAPRTLMRRRLMLPLAAALVLAACKEPTAPQVPPLTVQLATGGPISPQGSIQLVFNRPVSSATATDPANIVVTNTCTGLPVPGALRLGPAGTTVTFTPTQTIPFLTPLSVRVQGVLDSLQQAALPQPQIFNLTVEPPPVPDLTWGRLNSPTNDAIVGIAFPDRQHGYLGTTGGAIFRTTNGGQFFAAAYKNQYVNNTLDLQAFGADTLFMVANLATASNPIPIGALFMSADSATTFDTLATFVQSPASLAVHRAPGGAGYVALIGAQASSSQPAVYRYSTAGGITTSTGLASGWVMKQAAWDTTGQYALAAMLDAPTRTTSGALAVSSDSGRSFTMATFATAVPALYGAAFIPGQGTTALVVGDSSYIARFDAATGSYTELGAAAGIPQANVDSVTGEVVLYQFRRVQFANAQVGWVVGNVLHRFPGTSIPDTYTGVILMTTDGGHTFVQQGVQGTGNNGQNFAPLERLAVLAPDFVVTGGREGFVATRRSETTSAPTACSFNENR